MNSTENQQWHVDNNYDVLDEESLLIARPHHKEHAFLLAAAPELLAACKLAQAALHPEGHTEDERLNTRRQCRLAIAKAERASRPEAADSVESGSKSDPASVIPKSS